MPLTEKIMHTQFHDKVDEYKTLGYTKNSYKQEKFEETINDIYQILFCFETITSGEKHMPYLRWIYNDDLQHGCVGVDTCAVDMLNALSTDKNEILLIAHNLNYDGRFILEYLGNVKPMVKGGRFLQIKATYYNPKRKKIKTTIKDNYKLVPVALREFGKCFKLEVSKEYALQCLYL